MTGPDRVVVVGAGIAGATVAFGLARRGAAVTVIDDAAEGRATSAGAGILQPWSSAATGAYYELYARGAAYYPQLLARLAELGIDDVSYRQVGSLVVAADAGAIAAVEERLARRRADAAEMGDIERLDGAGLRAAFPPLRSDLHGLAVPGGARVDGRRLVAGVLTAAERLGTTVMRGAVRVTSQGGRVAVHVAGSASEADRVGPALDADAVVVAGGAWTKPLLAPLGIVVDVEPQRGQIAHLHLAGAATGSWPTVLPVADHYLVAFEGGRIVAGATRETGSGFDPRLTAAGVRQVLEDALALAPGLTDATVVEVRVGLRPLAAGGSPTVGAVPGHDGVYVATGYGPAGLTMAPVLGDALAELVITGRAPFPLPFPEPAV
jgi:D-amino-acid dehydrogenase